MTSPYILAIDNGTQSTRALLFDLQGQLVDKVRVPFLPAASSSAGLPPGWVEQEPAYFWHALCQACQQLWQQTKVNKQAVVAVALTTQRGTVINLDRAGKPLRPAIIWLDQRRTAGLKPIGGVWGVIFKLIGMRETIAHFQAEAEANWIRIHQPDIWQKTHKYLLLSGYLSYRLTGRFVDSTGAQVGYIPFDYKRLRWARWYDWKWRVVPMERTLLPELLPPTAQLGQISTQAAEATGIPAGLPLIAAAADKACEVLGSGALAPDTACLSYGTTATINVTQRRYLEAIPFIPPFPAALPNAYNIEMQIYRGYWMVEWFKEQFDHPEQAMASQEGISPYDGFEDLLHQVPPGSMGLILQPYWSPGIKEPGPEAKGAIIGFGDVHTRAHLYRAMLEGLAYALREGMERIEKCSQTKIRELRVAGGGAQSDAALQLTADIFGLPVTRPHTYETSGLGAAIDAAVGLGYYPDMEKAVQKMTHSGQRFEPQPEAQQIYEQLYQEVYKEVYQRLQPLYQKISQITGYPAKTGAARSTKD